jgi:hypothetical protein
MYLIISYHIKYNKFHLTYKVLYNVYDKRTGQISEPDKNINLLKI